MRFPPSLRRLETLVWAVLLVLFAGFAARVLFGMVNLLTSGRWVAMDFFAQWSFARFAWGGLAGAIYDTTALHAFQVGLAPGLRQFFPYPYPPQFLLIIFPLAWMTLEVAFAAWMAATWALYLAAAWPRRGGWLACGLVLLAPAVAVNMSYGQNGFLTAALLLGGFRLLPARPVLAGIAFGLLAFKPQFGLLIPVALLAGGQWRAIMATSVTVVTMAVATGLVFGWQLWAEWLAYLPVHAEYLDTAVNHYRKPTLQGALLLAGFGPAIARAAPLVVLALAMPLVWWCFRVRSPLAVAALVAGTFAGMPYGFLYDLPAVTGAAVAVLAVRPDEGSRMVDDAIVALALAVPAIMTLTSRFYWVGGVAMLLLFGLTVWRDAPWRGRAAP